MQMMHDWQYIGERKALMYNKEHTCPMQCGEMESKMHYLWCRDTQIQDKQQHCLRLLQKQLGAINMFPGTITAISKVLTNGFDEEWISDIEQQTHLDKLLHDAIKTQQQLGQNSLPKAT